MRSEPFEASADRTGRRSPAAFVILGSTLVAILVGAFLLCLVPRRAAEMSMVRISNETGTALQNVYVNGVGFGDLAVGGVSQYKGLTPAYSYAALRLEAAGKKFESTPDDYFNETPLGLGKFTYSIQREEFRGETHFEIGTSEFWGATHKARDSGERSGQAPAIMQVLPARR